MQFSTAETLGAAQIGRVTPFPQRLGDFTLPKVFLEGLRRRNTFEKLLKLGLIAKP